MDRDRGAEIPWLHPRAHEDQTKVLTFDAHRAALVLGAKGP